MGRENWPYTTRYYQRARKSPNIIIALCGLLILFDGYDLIVYGAVVPALLGEAGWGLTPGMVGRAASLTLFGMLLGALIAGTLADRIGRRKVIIGSLLSFSVMMIGSGLAPNFTVFEGTRFLAGLGLGALFPTVTALIIEFSPPKRKAIAYSIALLGYLVRRHHFRPSRLAADAGIWLAAVDDDRRVPILLLPFFMRLIPESPEWLATKNRQAEANLIANQFGLPNPVPRPVADRQDGHSLAVFQGRLLPTLNAWGIHFCSLLLTFGMVNWLPTIMNKMGYDIGSALMFSVTLNAGAAIGLLIGAKVADRGNVKLVVSAMFLIGALSIWLLTQVDQGMLVYGLVGLAGTGTIGTQILANVLVGNLYPVEIRGTGLGFSLGIGRIGGMIGPAIGGAVLGAGLAPQWNFYIFATVGIVGCVLALFTLLYTQKAH